MLFEFIPRKKCNIVESTFNFFYSFAIQQVIDHDSNKNLEDLTIQLGTRFANSNSLSLNICCKMMYTFFIIAMISCLLKISAMLSEKSISCRHFVSIKLNSVCNLTS